MCLTCKEARREHGTSVLCLSPWDRAFLKPELGCCQQTLVILLSLLTSTVPRLQVVTARPSYLSHWNISPAPQIEFRGSKFFYNEHTLVKKEIKKIKPSPSNFFVLLFWFPDLEMKFFGIWEWFSCYKMLTVPELVLTQQSPCLNLPRMTDRQTAMNSASMGGCYFSEFRRHFLVPFLVAMSFY